MKGVQMDKARLIRFGFGVTCLAALTFSHSASAYLLIASVAIAGLLISTVMKG